MSRYTLFLALVDFHAFKRAAPAWDLPGTLQQPLTLTPTPTLTSNPNLNRNPNLTLTLAPPYPYPYS